MGTLDLLEGGIHLPRKVADVLAVLMRVVHLDVVLDGSRVGHASGAAVVDGDGLVQLIKLISRATAMVWQSVQEL